MAYKIKMIGEIGCNITPEFIMEELSNANGDNIDFMFSSLGGSISKGLIIGSLLKDYKDDFPNAKLNLKVTAEAASMGSHLMALPVWDHITVEETTVHMRHNPQSIAMGDYIELEKATNFMKKYTDVMAIEYSRKSGMSLDQTKRDMDKTTWLFGKEIVDAGFADEVVSSDRKMQKDVALSMCQSKFKTFMGKLPNEKFEMSEYTTVMGLISMSDENMKIDYYDGYFNFDDPDLEMIDIKMPYPNEHAARVRDPDDFQDGTFRRKRLPKSKGGKGGVSIIIGKLKGKTAMIVQAYRFPKDLYTVAEAKAWLKENNVKYILFEPASGDIKNKNMQNPAMSGKNNQEDIMDFDEVKKTYSSELAGIEMAGEEKGKAAMIANNKAIMELKEKEEFKNLPFIQERCNKALMEGEDLADVKMAINAMLLDPKMQASVESPGDISTGTSVSMSGESAKIVKKDVRW